MGRGLPLGYFVGSILVFKKAKWIVNATTVIIVNKTNISTPVVLVSSKRLFSKCAKIFGLSMSVWFLSWYPVVKSSVVVFDGYVVWIPSLEMTMNPNFCDYKRVMHTLKTRLSFVIQ